ncbi:hypothetical protein Bca4012_100852 [Brassica carinata]
MSMWEIVKFSVKCGGYWVKNHRGDVGYIGGEVRTINCKPEELFNALAEEFGERLNVQRVWYKLPNEEHKDRKIMSNGDPMFLNMCEAGKWRGMINIFLVNTTEHCEVEEQVMPSEEEIRIENNVASFVDEDENFDHHNTPPNSDDEDNESFVRFRPGSGELELRQVFDTIEEFKEAVLEYALKGGWNIKLNKWGDIKTSAVCGTKEDCPWRIYCSYEERLGKWMVKTFSDKHRCQKDGYCKFLKSAVICKLFLNDIRTDPELKPRFIQDQIEQRYKFIATIDKCKKGKAKAIDIINHDHEEQFSRLKDYRLALLETNPESTVILDTILNDDGAEIFHRFYVCFATIRTLWSMWCRPIFGKRCQ